MLDMASIPVASGSICVNEDDLAETIKKLLPNRVKTIGWKSRKGALSMLKLGRCGLVWLFAKEYSKRIIVEKIYYGFDYRILVIDNKLVAAAKEFLLM
jgi:cyanophycin synthetase